MKELEESKKNFSSSKQFRVGNQTALVSKTVWEPFEYAISKGFDAFEWFPQRFSSMNLSPKIPGKSVGWKENDMAREERKRIKQMAIENDIFLSVHAPISVTVFTEEGHKKLEDSLDFAKDIGAKILNTHFERQQGSKAFFKAVLPFWRKAIQADMSVAVENIPGDPPEAMNELFSLISKENIPGKEKIGMCLDLGHANLYPTQNDCWQFLDRLEEDIPLIHMHIHENYGKNDEHLPVFTGPSTKDEAIGLKGALSRIINRNYHGMMILEQWPNPVSLLEDSRNKLLACLKEMVL